VADEITQTRQIGQIQPPNRPRDSGARPRPRQPEGKQGDAGQKQRQRGGDGRNRVDEYA
jgi:hypothetical protein